MSRMIMISLLFLLSNGAVAAEVGDLTQFEANATAVAEEVNTNFSKVKSAVDANHGDIQSLSQSVNSQAAQINGLGGRLGGAEGSLDTHQSEIQTLSQSVNSHASQIGSQGSRLTAAEDKLDDYSSHGGGLQCREEYDLIEQGTTTRLYNPSQAKKAELFQYGWICWNRTDDMIKISPVSAGVTLNQRYDTWAGGTNSKVCGRINYISNSSTTNVTYLSHAQGGYYFGLRHMNGDANTWHGRWAAGGNEGSGSVGTGDRWTVYTCR